MPDITAQHKSTKSKSNVSTNTEEHTNSLHRPLNISETVGYDAKSSWVGYTRDRKHKMEFPTESEYDDYIRNN